MKDKLWQKISGMNFHYQRYPLEFFFDAMQKYNIQNIELWAASPHFYLEDISFSDVRKVKRDITNRKLNLVCFTPEQCIYPINIASSKKSLRERSINYFKKSLDIANELESPLHVITPGTGYFNELEIEAWKRSASALHELSEYARGRGVTLLLEPLRKDLTHIVNDHIDAKKMLDEVQSPNLKSMIDTVSLDGDENKMSDYFRVLNKEIFHIHFIDGNPEGHLAWGDGNLPLKEYVKVLKANDYQGYLTLEYINTGYYNDPDKAIEKTIATFNHIFSE